MELHTSGEDYLEAVLILSRTCPEVRSVDIAEHLGVSRPSVSRAVSLLRRGGFLESEGGISASDRCGARGRGGYI